MSREWFLQQDGKTYGPLSSTKLKELTVAGKVSRQSMVANSKDGPWHPASNIKGLPFPQPTEPELEPALQPSPARPAPQPIIQQTVSQEPAQQQAVTQQRAAPETSSEPTHETPIWTGHPSQITNIKTYIFCGLFFWLIIPLFVAIWRFLEVKYLTYELTTERLKISQGVIARRTDEVELYRVKDTSISQNMFQRIFGLGTIELTTSDATHPKVWIHSIKFEKAKELREKLRMTTEQLRDRKKVREVDFA